MATATALERSIAPQALPGALLLGLGAVLVGIFVGFVYGAALGLLLLGHCAFFRNPRREPPPGDGRVVAPADGRVVAIDYVEDAFVGRSVRIAIFLSIFNVHVNRMPLSAKVRARARTGSRFLAAFDPRASDLNVQARLDLETPSGLRFAVAQITGLIARRIVCYPEEGDVLERGRPYGLIHYGSRVELWLPADAELRVARGDRVRAGASVMAEVSV